MTKSKILKGLVRTIGLLFEAIVGGDGGTIGGLTIGGGGGGTALLGGGTALFGGGGGGGTALFGAF